MHINSTTTDKSLFANNQEKKHPSYGMISLVKKTVVKALLIDDIWVSYIFPLLNERDIISTTRTFKCASMAFSHNKHIISYVWFSRFTSQQQASFKRCIEKMSEAETYRWMCQFAKKKSITQFLTEKTIAYCPESLIFKRALLMRGCPLFKVEEKCLIKHDKGIKSATFSADSLHLVTTSRDSTARIYGQDSSGEWVLKTIINHHSGWIKSAIFSADDSHVITLDDERTAKIYGQDLNGEWMEKTTIQYPAGYADSAIFSTDSHHAMLSNKTKTSSTVQIYGRDSNGEWARSAIINNDGDHKRVTAIFSPDSRNVLIIFGNEAAQIYEHDSSDGTWTKQAGPEPNQTSLFGTFSADGRHVALTHKDKSTGIYRQDLNGQWTKKILINHGTLETNFTLEPTFSNNGSFVMIASDDGKAVKICGQSSSGEWTEKATIQHQQQVCCIAFSSDSCHVVTTGFDGAVQIYSKMADNEWIQKAATQYQCWGGYYPSVAFSADNRHMLTSSLAHPTITIYSWAWNGEWTENHILHLGVNHISKATFSVDGSHVLICSRGNVKIYGLDSKDNTWKEKAHITHIGATTASISADCGHVVTLNGNSVIAKIWRLCRDRTVYCSPSPCKKMKLR